MADESLVAPALSPAMMPTHAAPDLAAEGAPAPEDAAPENAAPAPELPHELVKMPGMMALMAGSPPALSVRLKDKKKDDPDVAMIRKHKDVLQQAGFGFYKSLSGEFGVIFNSLYVHPEDLRAADKQGQLQHLAPPADAVHHAIAKSGLSNPVLRINQPPGAPAAQRSITPPQSASGMLPVPSQQAPASAGAQSKAQGARLAGLTPGGPLTGPKPGAGRLLNQILKPVQ